LSPVHFVAGDKIAGAVDFVDCTGDFLHWRQMCTKSTVPATKSTRCVRGLSVALLRSDEGTVFTFQ